MPVVLRADVSQLNSYVSRINIFKRFFVKRKIKKAFDIARFLFEQDFKRVAFNSGNAHSRSGKMAASIEVRTRLQNDIPYLELSSDHPGIFTQIYGATIVPKTAGALAIPFRWAAPNGNPSWPSPLARSDFSVVKSSSGMAYLKRNDLGRLSHTLTKIAVVPISIPAQTITDNFVKRVLVPLLEREVDISI